MKNPHLEPDDRLLPPEERQIDLSDLDYFPPATARVYARSPEGMAMAAVALAALAVVAGLAASLVLDTPAGPSIVTASAAFFAGTLGGAALRRAILSRVRA